MSRRHRAEKREINPDPKFGDLVVSKFMNNLMYEGKKSVAEGIVYGAFDKIQAKAKADPIQVFHEALNNVARHAGVRAASVTLRQMDDGLLLAVADRGAGFDPQSRGSGMSLGLASMRERVRLVHGTLEIESAPGHGTTVLAWVPADGGSR